MSVIECLSEVQHFAVEIVAPGAVDDAGEEQPRDQEEVRHAEGPGEGDRGMHPALAAGCLLDAQGECIVTTMICRNPWRVTQSIRLACGVFITLSVSPHLSPGCDFGRLHALAENPASHVSSA